VIQIIHDATHHTLIVWLEDPSREHVCEETSGEVILMKDERGRIIGLEVLHYHPAGRTGLSVQTVVRTEA
jgi:hypothetical protein